MLSSLYPDDDLLGMEKEERCFRKKLHLVRIESSEGHISLSACCQFRLLYSESNLSEYLDISHLYIIHRAL